MEKNYQDLLNHLKENQESCWLDVQGVIIQAAEENNQDFYAWLQLQGEDKSFQSIVAALDLNGKNPLTFERIPECFKEAGWDYINYERYADRWMENN